jgi:hypothetical protein
MSSLASFAYEQAAHMQQQYPMVTDLGAGYTGVDLQQLHANDKHFQNTLWALRKPGSVPAASAGRLSVGLIVGESRLHSIMPELASVDIVVMADHYAKLHTWQRADGRAFRESPTPLEYALAVSPSGIDEAQLLYKLAARNAFDKFTMQSGSLEHPVETWQKDDAHSLQGMHFLKSAERYAACREAYMGKPIVWAAGLDFMKPTDVETLGKNITNIGGEITFLNLTNVHEAVPQIVNRPHNPGEELAAHDAYHENLRALPVGADAFVAYSSNVDYWVDEDGTEPHFLSRIPTSRDTRSLDQYTAICKEEAPYFVARHIVREPGVDFRFDTDGKVIIHKIVTT